MTANNPFNFIDPRLLQFPANKTMICPPEQLQHEETYFSGNSGNAKREQRKQRWAYDNFVFGNLPFVAKKRRGDRINIEEHMVNIQAEELRRLVPVCTQSWYGHRTATYDERIADPPVGKVQEMLTLNRRNGMPFPKRNAFGREEVCNRTLIETIKTKL